MDKITTDSASTANFEDVCRQLQTDPQNGLTWNEAKRRVGYIGHNELNVQQAESLISKYFEQVCFLFFTFIHLLIILFYFSLKILW